MSTPEPSPWRHVFAGTTFAVIILLCVFGGIWIDRRLGSAPWGTLLGAIFGVSAGFYHFLREFKDEP